MGALRASLGQALSSGELLEGLPKGDVATPGTVKYVKKAAREALNILQGMLAQANALSLGVSYSSCRVF